MLQSNENGVRLNISDNVHWPNGEVNTRWTDIVPRSLNPVAEYAFPA